MPKEIYLTRVGMTMSEGVVAEWFIADGESVKQGELLYRLETEKVDMEVDADHSGTVKHLVEPGVTREPGDVVGWIYEAGETIPDVLPKGEKLAADDMPVADEGGCRSVGARFSDTRARRSPRSAGCGRRPGESRDRRPHPRFAGCAEACGRTGSRARGHSRHRARGPDRRGGRASGRQPGERAGCRSGSGQGIAAGEAARPGARCRSRHRRGHRARRAHHQGRCRSGSARASDRWARARSRRRDPPPVRRSRCAACARRSAIGCIRASSPRLN